jgi:hypothetical protein
VGVVGVVSCFAVFVVQVDNTKLARQVANTQLRSKDTQKRLWLKVAKHVIRKDEDIGK